MLKDGMSVLCEDQVEKKWTYPKEIGLGQKDLESVDIKTLQISL